MAWGTSAHDRWGVDSGLAASIRGCPKSDVRPAGRYLGSHFDSRCSAHYLWLPWAVSRTWTTGDGGAMNTHLRILGLLLLSSLLTASCAPPSSSTTIQEAAAAAPKPGKALVMMSSAEPPSLSEKKILAVGATNPRAHGEEFLNAGLVYIDDRSLAQPYLVEALPELNTSDWH